MNNELNLSDLRVTLDTQGLIDELLRDDTDEAQTIELLHKLADNDDAWDIVTDGLTISLSPAQLAKAIDNS